MPHAIRSILCALDFSSFSPLVMRQGMTLARRSGLRLYLFHAVHHPQDRLYPTPLFERGGELTRSMVHAGKRLNHLMADAKVDWQPVVRFGDPVEQIIAVVRELPPCLVVSAAHGVSGFRRFFIGTVVERLSRTLGRPMLVVRADAEEGGGRDHRFRSVVIGCDDRGHWRRQASLLALLRADSAVRVHLVHAMEGPVEETPVALDEAPYGQAQQAAREHLVRSYRRQARSLFPETDRISIAVAPGDPAQMVLQAARERAADLIVVGVRHSGTVRRLISGSTTETLLRHAPCCVLTVPESQEPAVAAGDSP